MELTNEIANIICNQLDSDEDGNVIGIDACSKTLNKLFNEQLSKHQFMIDKEMYLLSKKIVVIYESNLTKNNSVNKKVELKPVSEKVIDGIYYWKRVLWNPEFGGNVKIVSEGGSKRGKGWQVVYIDNNKTALSNKHYNLPIDTYCTYFAYDEDLFEEVK